MSFQLRRDSALDLTLQGTVGSFRVGSASSGTKSLEVKFLLTHVGLSFSTSSNDKLLGALAPVREIFDVQSLDFDEIMQRDIDDARVSSELIPYLLDNHSRDMIKLFPPIVVVVMPARENRNQPAGKYPAVSSLTLAPDADRSHPVLVTRSGAPGDEVFEFEQPVLDGKPVISDLVRLKINTQKSRLVIVDGQHRAMALLAIFRNLKDQWADERRTPYKEYYAAWTKNYIEQFKLDEINLPVMLCTVPELDENYRGDFDMKKAARSIFLILNKTARQVSDSRNKLLDDNDLISFLMRRTLSHIKEKDARSEYGLRITNIELDQEGSRQKIQTSIAISGVPHVYYIIEHLMLSKGDEVSGVKPRSGAFANRISLAEMLERLDGRDALGTTVADAIRRNFFTSDAATILGARFDEKYGNLIIACLERFEAYNVHNVSVLELGQWLEREHDRNLRPILLDGQGIGRVFEAHRKNLKQLKSKLSQRDAPEIEASIGRLNATAHRLSEAVKRLHRTRAEKFLSELNDKKILRDENGEIRAKIIDWCNELFDNVFSTIAFQAALVCGFQGLVEKADRQLHIPQSERDVALEEYLQQLNKFFVPRTLSQLKKLIRVMNGEVGEDELWTIRPSNQTFRNIVFRGEMQPDQWPKYRYLMLEIWKPTLPTLQALVNSEREHCRKDVFKALHTAAIDSFCIEKRKIPDELIPEERKAIFDQCFESYAEFLRNLSTISLSKSDMRNATREIPDVISTEEPEEAVKD
jgi:hypothetical protein